MYNGSQTKSLIIELSIFCTEIGLQIKNDKSNAIAVESPDGEQYKISQAQLESLKQIMEKKPELQDETAGLYATCSVFINLFKNEWS